MPSRIKKAIMYVSGASRQQYVEKDKSETLPLSMMMPPDPGMWIATHLDLSSSLDR